MYVCIKYLYCIYIYIHIYIYTQYNIWNSPRKSPGRLPSPSFKVSPSKVQASTMEVAWYSSDMMSVMWYHIKHHIIIHGKDSDAKQWKAINVNMVTTGKKRQVPTQRVIGS